MKFSQNNRRRYQKTSKKQARQRKKQQARKKVRNRRHQEDRNLVFRFRKTIDQYFPDLYERIEAIPDCRKQQEYSLLELILAGMAMYLFKKGSRNAMNNERDESKFRKNYSRLFKARLPHMDTVDEVIRVLEPVHIERLKRELIRGLLAKKLLRRHRLFGQYYRVVIDGTHVMNVPEGHCPSCLHQTSTKGKIRYFHNVLEAKLVTDTGLCVSLETEWIENAEDYNKQDCELKAFIRLAKALKAEYPRLSCCIVADGLYPNQTFFQSCRDNGWAWIVTLKDGNLPSIWAKVLQRQGRRHCRHRDETVLRGEQTIQRHYEWHPNLRYQAFTVQWFACEELVDETVTRFVYLSSLEMDYYSVLEVTRSGRMRWKIENQGFDIQKHHGYALGHQFSRRSMRAMKNYYQLMQIAHLINQMFELSSLLADVRGQKESLAHVWDCLLGELRHEALDWAVLAALLARKIRVWLA